MKKYVVIFDQVKKSWTIANILDFIPTEEEQEFLDQTNGLLSFSRNSRTEARETFSKTLLERVLKEHKLKKIQFDKITEIRPMTSYDKILSSKHENKNEDENE